MAKIAKNAINAGKTAAAANETDRGGCGECDARETRDEGGENEKLVDF